MAIKAMVWRATHHTLTLKYESPILLIEMKTNVALSCIDYTCTSDAFVHTVIRLVRCSFCYVRSSGNKINVFNRWCCFKISNEYERSRNISCTCRRMKEKRRLSQRKETLIPSNNTNAEAYRFWQGWTHDLQTRFVRSLVAGYKFWKE